MAGALLLKGGTPPGPGTGALVLVDIRPDVAAVVAGVVPGLGDPERQWTQGKALSSPKWQQKHKERHCLDRETV